MTTGIAHTRGSARRSLHGNVLLLPRWRPTLTAGTGTSDAVQDSYADTTGWAD
jgi:hypothetical protein